MNQALRFCLKVGNWLFQKLWAEPVAIKGWVWTVALFVAVGMGAVIVQARQLGPLVLLLVALWVMNWQDSKPKKLGRPLPYRRRR